MDLLNVGAACERLVSRAADDDDAHGVVSLRKLRGGADIPPHFGAERVAHLGTVQREIEDAVFYFIQYVLKFHGRDPFPDSMPCAGRTDLCQSTKQEACHAGKKIPTNMRKTRSIRFFAGCGAVSGRTQKRKCAEKSEMTRRICAKSEAQVGGSFTFSSLHRAAMEGQERRETMPEKFLRGEKARNGGKKREGEKINRCAPPVLVR